MYRLICWIVGLWRSRNGIPIEGCDYVDTDVVDVPALVTVAKCEVCGKLSITWKRKEV